MFRQTLAAVLLIIGLVASVGMWLLTISTNASHFLHVGTVTLWSYGGSLHVYAENYDGSDAFFGLSLTGSWWGPAWNAYGDNYGVRLPWLYAAGLCLVTLILLRRNRRTQRGMLGLCTSWLRPPRL